jgi:hypothetical protein
MLPIANAQTSGCYCDDRRSASEAGDEAVAVIGRVGDAFLI